MIPAIQFLGGPGLFRLALALLVFVHHTTRVSLGMSAVYIFFELSGFWICAMWNGRYSKAPFPYAVYIVSRAWRLIPVFVLCAAVSWGVIYWLKQPVPEVNWARQALSNLFILGYSSLDFQSNRPAWTLDIELQFYLVAPFVILLMRRRIWLPLAACVVVALVGYLLDYPYAPQPHPYTLSPHPVTVLPYLIFFAIGVAAASARWQPGRLVALGSLAGTLLLILICVASPLHGLIIGGAHPDSLYHRFNEAANVLIALLMVPWAIFTTRQRSVRLDPVLGDLSYIVYLLQWPVLAVLDPSKGTTMHRGWTELAALGTVLFGSVAIWALYDHPLNKARSRWVGRQVMRPARLVDRPGSAKLPAQPQLIEATTGAAASPVEK
jgi:peptidoglycan/LPS O-acetylase OafA/YrhL